MSWDWAKLIDVPILHPALDRTPATDLLWEFDSLPRAAKVFFTVRQYREGEAAGSFQPGASETARLNDYVERLAADIDLAPPVFETFLTARLHEVEQAFVKQAYRTGINLLVVAVGLVSIRSQFDEWTEERFRLALETSRLFLELEEPAQGHKPLYLLDYAMGRTLGGLWVPAVPFFPAGTLIGFDDAGAAITLSAVPFFSSGYLGFTERAWRSLHSEEDPQHPAILKRHGEFWVNPTENVRTWEIRDKAGREGHQVRVSYPGSAFDLWSV